MRHFNNKAARDLSYEEHMAIIEAARLLEKAFKKKVFAATIAPNDANAQDVYGVQFNFDLASEGYR